MSITIPRRTARQDGPTGAQLRRLYERTLHGPVGGKTHVPEYLEVEGRLCVRLAHCRTLIASMSLDPSSRLMALLGHASAKAMDVLIVDLSRPNSVVDCAVDLNRPERVQRDVPANLVLWFGADGTPALVPDLPRGYTDFTIPTFRATPEGLVVVPRPFDHAQGWLSGVMRGLVAAAEARHEPVVPRQELAR